VSKFGAVMAAVLVAWAAPALAQGVMYGQVIPTPLLVPPGLHARFLGEPVHTTQLDGAVFAYGGFWTVTTGYPALLQEVLPSGQVAVRVPLPGAYGAWALAPGPDDTLWIGTFHKGMVFRYTLGSQKAQEVVRLPDVNTVWALVYRPADGHMWAGTWPNGVWTIDPRTGSARRVAQVPGETGPRSLGVVGDQVLAGAYPTMNVVVASTPGLPPLLPNVAQLLGGPGQVQAIGDLQGHAVVLGGSGQLLWVGPVQGTNLGYQTLSDCQSLPLVWQGHIVVFRRDQVVPISPGVPGRFHADNLPLAGPPLASLPPGKVWVAYGTVGPNVYALASDGTLVDIPPQGPVAQVRPDLSAAAGIIQTMTAVGQAIWGSSYLGGEVWRYQGGSFTRYGGMNQVDSMVPCGPYVYMGVYPNGRLYAYDPRQPWNPPQNPHLVGSPGYPADRAPGLACVQGVAYMGTVPQNTSLGGVVYSSLGRTYPSPVPGETPVSHQNALGTPRPPLPAHLFRLDPKTGLAQVVSLGHKQTFAGLWVMGAYVYAASRQYVARWNPQTGQLMMRRFTVDALPQQNWGMTTHFFQVGGRLYLVDDGWLYLVNPVSLQVTRLFYGVQQVAVLGSEVYLAFYDSRWLLQVSAANIWGHDGHVWPPPPGWKNG
jgi:hypothetical protein